MNVIEKTKIMEVLNNPSDINFYLIHRYETILNRPYVVNYILFFIDGKDIRLWPHNSKDYGFYTYVKFSINGINVTELFPSEFPTKDMIIMLEDKLKIPLIDYFPL